MTRQYGLRHELCCAAMTGQQDAKFFNERVDAAVALQSDVAAELFPWVPRADRAATARRMTAQWETTFGVLDDPETARKVRATVEFLHRNAAEGRAQNAFGGSK